MTVTIDQEFAPGNRYMYDSALPNDFAQVDTSQDASYFGNWASAKRRVLFSYCEGDCTTIQCETNDEFRQEVLKIKQWNEDNGHKFNGIDPGWKPDAKLMELWTECGLSDLMV